MNCLAASYNSLYGMEIVSLRITEVYGPGLWMPSLLGDMIRAGLRGETFTLDPAVTTRSSSSTSRTSPPPPGSASTTTT